MMKLLIFFFCMLFSFNALSARFVVIKQEEDSTAVIDIEFYDDGFRHIVIYSDSLESDSVHNLIAMFLTFEYSQVTLMPMSQQNQLPAPDIILRGVDQDGDGYDNFDELRKIKSQGINLRGVDQDGDGYDNLDELRRD